jgi:hyperosmotically inducible periplasmic protein
MSARIFSIVVGLMLVTSAAFAQTTNDDLLAMDVVRSVNTYTRFTIFDDINVRVENGTVTLLGKVTMPFKRDEIGKRIERLNGVVAVNNEIEVLPVSIFDDELRRKVARAIYGNSAFWRYAAMVNPPIHIIVERGRVTLTGVVGSEVDRALARSLATGRGELSVINALKTDAEVNLERRAAASLQLAKDKGPRD